MKFQPKHGMAEMPLAISPMSCNTCSLNCCAGLFEEDLTRISPPEVRQARTSGCLCNRNRSLLVSASLSGTIGLLRFWYIFWCGCSGCYVHRHAERQNFSHEVRLLSTDFASLLLPKSQFVKVGQVHQYSISGCVKAWV